MHRGLAQMVLPCFCMLKRCTSGRLPLLKVERQHFLGSKNVTARKEQGFFSGSLYKGRT
jgi:hypothetical protein